MRDDYTLEETAYWNGRADEKKEWEDKIKAKIEEYEEIKKTVPKNTLFKTHIQAQIKVLQSLFRRE